MAPPDNGTTRPKYFTLDEVATHNWETDLWVVVFDRVLDVTSLLAADPTNSVALINHAGRDISHMFDPDTGDVKTRVDPQSNRITPFLPHGPLPHVPPVEPRSDVALDIKTAWWKDDTYLVGRLTKNVRRIVIKNTMTFHEHTIDVCTEETLNEILQRYLPYNDSASCYVWKHIGRRLDMDKTLEENGIQDDSGTLRGLDLDPDDFPLTLHLHFHEEETFP